MADNIEGVTVIGHPLVQHKLTIMRDKETSTRGFRQLLRETAALICYEATRDLPLETVRDRDAARPDAGEEDRRQEARLRLDPARRQRAAGRACSTSCPRRASPISASTATTRRCSRSSTTSRRRRTLSDRTVICVDPMLATANSSVAAVDKLKSRGAKDIRFVCLLAAPEGIKHFREAHPDVPIYTAAIDSHLNEQGYIVPGLGDAGDRMYGTK